MTFLAYISKVLSSLFESSPDLEVLSSMKQVMVDISTVELIALNFAVPY